MTGFPLNPPNTPIGTMNGVPIVLAPEWFRFFRDIQGLIGGDTQPWDDSSLLTASVPAPPMPPSEAYVDLTPPSQRAVALDAEKQPLDPLLTSIAALTFGADSFIYGTGSDTAAAGTVTAYARTLLDDANAGAALTTLGVSAFIQTLLDDADAAAARSTLGISGNLSLVSDSASAIAFSFVISGTTYYLQAGTGTLAGDTTGTVTFPQAFATRAFCVVAGGNSNVAQEGDISAYSVSTTAASIKNSAPDSGSYWWVAVGY